MCTPGLHWFPLAVFIVLPGTFILSYIIAVWLGHVEADFPYISDTGAVPPESCIFGQLLNIAAVLAAITTYIRYRQVEYYAGSVHMKRSNKVTLFMGLLSCLGISMVGNFQETEVLPMHIVGAMLAFGVSIVYCWVQTVMSYAACPRLGSKVLCHIRVAVCIIASVAFVITYVFNAISMHYYHGHDKRKWFPKRWGVHSSRH
ncbi:DNA damage-regulated autophagy modulator protein 2 [Lamellibrachia satsuma]|nr:DNA damage-regulated autophagy modulator protein 2 [Lamellibrachia satsuma]